MGFDSQIVFEADHLNQYVYVDDLSVYNAPCSTEGRKKMLFFKQFNKIVANQVDECLKCLKSLKLHTYSLIFLREGIRVPRCPPGSVENNIGGQITCYVFHMEPKTYIEAMKACKAIWPQASLVAIETAAEQAFISNMINTSHGN